MTQDNYNGHYDCSHGNRNALSQASTLPIPPRITEHSLRALLIADQFGYGEDVLILRKTDVLGTLPGSRIAGAAALICLFQTYLWLSFEGPRKYPITENFLRNWEVFGFSA